MTRQPVKSSNIKSVGYDRTARALEIEFHSGQVHQYADVPPTKHAEMLKAKSIGQYFHQSIRTKHKSKQIQ
jgi:hypothetical protein